MPLKLVKINPGYGRIVLIASAVMCSAALFFFIKWHFANAVASQLDPLRPESRLVVDWLTGASPGDPKIHFLAGSLFEKTLDPVDLTRSVLEYETAAAISPNNYVMWVNLGKVRSLSGDVAGAEAAFRRAFELAPNYAAVEWVYGNFLVRQGRADEGFALMVKAAAGNPAFAAPAATTAFQIFDGDIDQIRKVMGENDVTNAALAGVLAAQQRYDEAWQSWARLADKTDKFRRTGEMLAMQMIGAKKYQFAALISADLEPNENVRPLLGSISNGGFEGGVKLRSPGLFEWQIAEGTQPQIGLSDGQKRTGQFSLFILFNSMGATDFRAVSQTVPVEPGGAFELELFYRSDVKTAAQLKWEVVDAANGTPLATTEPLAPAADWSSARARFTVPAGSDGVIVRFVRTGCIGTSCPINGRISFDDLSIRRL